MKAEESYNLDHLLSYSLNRASLLYKRRLYAEFLSNGIDVRPEQWHILMLLYHTPGMIQSDLAACTDKDPTNITRSIDALARAGFLERRANNGDRRCYCIYLTKQGLETIDRLLPAMKSVNLDMQKGLSGEEAKTLKNILETIRKNLGDITDRTNSEKRKKDEHENKRKKTSK